jgi:hypothetical protein
MPGYSTAASPTAMVHKHPELTNTIWQVLRGSASNLMPIRGPFDGFHATQAAVSMTCPMRFDNSKYAVNSRAVGGPGEIQPHHDPPGCTIVASIAAARSGRDDLRPGTCASARQEAGALRNGAPFRDWPLPASLARVRRKLDGSDDGDRQMVKVDTSKNLAVLAVS